MKPQFLTPMHALTREHNPFQIFLSSLALQKLNEPSERRFRALRRAEEGRIDMGQSPSAALMQDARCLKWQHTSEYLQEQVDG